VHALVLPGRFPCIVGLKTSEGNGRRHARRSSGFVWPPCLIVHPALRLAGGEIMIDSAVITMPETEALTSELA
jgi:hypothetical protein